MKSFETIANEATPKDYSVVAEIADCSQKNVRLVVRQRRGDHYNIQKIFSEFLIMREDFLDHAKEALKEKYRKQNTRRRTRRV